VARETDIEERLAAVERALTGENEEQPTTGRLKKAEKTAAKKVTAPHR